MLLACMTYDGRPVAPCDSKLSITVSGRFGVVQEYIVCALYLGFMSSFGKQRRDTYIDSNSKTKKQRLSELVRFVK